MLVPVPGCNLPRDEDGYNFLQSSMRMVVEQTFGQVYPNARSFPSISFVNP